ncbi:MAG: type II toxin-antitoxin system VapC family toxin [Bryobacterales bacterium]|nr:type II toxin-antitoxin system VapC family toxin [Bryobacterales bacterium]
MPAYIDSSVFLAILNGEEPVASDIQALFAELKRKKVTIYTSIITIQEVSVAGYTKSREPSGAAASEVSKIARIEGITRSISLEAAEIEAKVISKMKSREEKSQDNKRRKWDCFHIATAVHLKCSVLYSCDQGMLNRKAHLQLGDIEFSRPCTSNGTLF